MIRELRTNKKLTIKDLARETALQEKRIKLIERGLDMPSTTEMDTLAEVFDVSKEVILESLNGIANENVIGEGYVTAKPKTYKVYEPINIKVENKPLVLDLFAGIGGLSYGFEITNNFQTIAGLDLLDDRIQTFRLNHPHSFGFSYDINQFEPDNLLSFIPRKPEIVVGGAPCQGFSSIRPFRALTENDKRNNLFLSFSKYIEYYKPDWFVFENVVGLLTHKKGKTLKTLIKEFEGAGYTVDFRVLNAAFYGIPQLRERLIVVGNKKGIEFQWPEPTHFFDHKSMAGNENEYVIKPEESLPEAITVMEALEDLPEIKAGETGSFYREDIQLTGYQEYLRKDCTELRNHDATAHSPKMMKIIKNSGYNINAVKHLVTSGFSSCYSRLEPDRPSVTLTVNFVSPASNKCIHPYQHRALTPREGARIQGFPDKFKFFGNRTQIVKQIGNAVPPILSEVIAKKIFSYY